MGGLEQTHDPLVCHMTKKLLVELTDLIHIEDFYKNIQYDPFKVVCYILAACNERRSTASAVVCCRVSRLSNTQAKHLSRAQHWADSTWRYSDAFITCTWTYNVVVAKWLISSCPHLSYVSYKIYQIHLNDVPLTSQRKKYKIERIDQDAHDNEVYGSTEIEMSNYPTLLTHFEFSIHCADSGELSGTESEFVNCTCQKLWKTAARWHWGF